MNDLFVLLNSYALEYAAGDKTHENEFILTCFESVKVISQKKICPLVKKYGTAYMDLEEFSWSVTGSVVLSIAKYKPEHSFSGWLCTIALNAFRKKYNECNRHQDQTEAAGRGL